MPWDESLVNSLVYDEPDPNQGRVLSFDHSGLLTVKTFCDGRF